MALTTDGLIAEYFGGLATNGNAIPTVPTAPTTWDDIKGTYDGALTSFPDPLTSSEGWVGDGTASTPYALKFGTGVHDNKVVCASSSALLSGVSALSIDAWFWAPSSPGDTYPRVFDKTNGNTTGYAMYISPSSGWIGLQLKVSGAALYDSQVSSGYDARNVITYACMTYSDVDDGLRLYINSGTQNGGVTITGGGTVQVSSDSLVLGNRGSDNARGWDGWISTVRFYNKQLNTTEIQANYDAGILATTGTLAGGATWTGMRVVRHV